MLRSRHNRLQSAFIRNVMGLLHAAGHGIETRELSDSLDPAGMQICGARKKPVALDTEIYHRITRGRGHKPAEYLGSTQNCSRSISCIRRTGILYKLA